MEKLPLPLCAPCAEPDVAGGSRSGSEGGRSSESGKRREPAAERGRTGQRDEELGAFLSDVFSAEDAAGGSEGGLPTENGGHQKPSAERGQGVSQGEAGDEDENEEVDAFLADFGARHDEDAARVREFCLREWIDRARQATGGTGTAFRPSAPGYVRAALSVALRLTEFLCEAERERGDAIPRASLVPGNVLLRARAAEPAEGGGSGGEEVEYAWIMSRMGDDPEVGDILPRLAALGVVLCELFSGGAVTTRDQEGALRADVTSSAASLRSVKVNDASGSPDRPMTRGPRRRVSDAVPPCLGNIELMGLPRSVSALLKNLLSCSDGDFCDDATFASYDDVRADLRLMLADPARFLDDLPTNPLPCLEVPDRLYGREEELRAVEASYRRLGEGTCRGLLIAGAAGAGKSALARRVGELTRRAGGYVVGAKYEQRERVMPLSVIAGVFDALFHMFAQDATPAQLASVGEALGLARGGDGAASSPAPPAPPSLSTLVPADSGMDSFGGCVDVRLRLKFLFSQLLRAITSHSRSISLFFDDVQWADPSSLALIASLISTMKGSRRVFFTCCYREEDEGSIHEWASSVARSSFTTIKLKSMSEAGVNDLVSETLHVSPRITRPLSSVLHHKTKGNPLFLRQLMESLKNQGHIYFKLDEARWAWDLNKVLDMELSEGVVLMLINEMRRLPPDVQTSLKVASCLGCVKYSVLDIFSDQFDLDLHRLSEQGFMRYDSQTSSFRWVHDKIEQSARELMSDQERRELHMHLGLAMSSHIPNDDTANDELLFAAVNQINCGGLSGLADPTKLGELASLNLNAGKRAVVYSDYNAALKLFERGVSFLPPRSWDDHYDLTVALFDAAAEAAGITNNRRKVDSYSKQLMAHAKCFDDKLNCLYSRARAQRQANEHKESLDSFLSIIQQCGEELPLPMGNDQLKIKMQAVNQILQIASDESILGMGETKNKRVVILLKIYTELAVLLTFVKPSLIGAVSLRMVDITMTSGLTTMTSCAFAFYCATLMNMGDEHVAEACRLAKIALKLLEGRESHKSRVILIAYYGVLWASDPFQCIVKAHQDGYRAGMQSGDMLYSVLNESGIYIVGYVAGQNLTILRKQWREFYLKLEKMPVVLTTALVYHVEIVVLQEGKSCLQDDLVDGLPGLRKIKKDIEEVEKNGERLEPLVSLMIKNFHVQRALLFRQFDEISFANTNVSDIISEEKHQLRPALLMGIFYEGLVSFQLARRTSHETRNKWIAKGSSALTTMQHLTNHCRWNFENKMLLLEAEKMHTLGQLDQAADLYSRSICSAQDHKFIHEVAIASESAGDLFYERRVLSTAVALYKHSIKCYKEWGAFAVARRVEYSLQSRIEDLDISQFDSNDVFLGFTFASQQGSSNKRPI